MATTNAYLPPSPPKKEKKTYLYECIYTEVETGRHSKKKFNSITSARNWSQEKIGPEYRINSNGIVLSHCTMHAIFPKGLSARQLMIDPIPEGDIKQQGLSLPARARERRHEKIKLLLMFVPSLESKLDGACLPKDILEIISKIDSEFIIKIRKPNKKLR